MPTIQNAPTPDLVQHLIANGEQALVEFKRQWFDIGSKTRNAKFIRSILALANTATPDEPGWLIIGVEDPKVGGELIGVPADRPDADTLHRLAGSWVQPNIEFSLHEVQVAKQTLDVVKVDWSPFRPHHSLREHHAVLHTNAVYCRRGGTIGQLTLPEIETIIRQKQAHIGPMAAGPPLEFGLVSTEYET